MHAIEHHRLKLMHLQRTLKTLSPWRAGHKQRPAKHNLGMRQPQDLQDLLLNPVGPRHLSAQQATIRSLDQYQAVIAKGAQDARHARPQRVATFRHQPDDRRLPLSQYAAHLALDQPRHQATHHDQQDEADNALSIFQKYWTTKKQLIGQAKTMLDLVLPLPLPQ